MTKLRTALLVLSIGLLAACAESAPADVLPPEPGPDAPACERVAACCAHYAGRLPVNLAEAAAHACDRVPEIVRGGPAACEEALDGWRAQLGVDHQRVPAVCEGEPRP